MCQIVIIHRWNTILVHWHKRLEHKGNGSCIYVWGRDVSVDGSQLCHNTCLLNVIQCIHEYNLNLITMKCDRGAVMQKIVLLLSIWRAEYVDWEVGLYENLLGSVGTHLLFT